MGPLDGDQEDDPNVKALKLASYDTDVRNGRSIFTEMAAPDLF